MSSIQFTIPYIHQTVDIPISRERIVVMNQYSQQVQSANPDEFGQMRETVIKVAPIAVAILAALVLTPIWLPIASISSFVLGPITWIMAGVIGSAVGQVAKRVMRDFDRQCPELVNYTTAVLLKCQQGDDTASEDGSRSPSPVGNSSSARSMFTNSFFGHGSERR